MFSDGILLLKFKFAFSSFVVFSFYFPFCAKFVCMYNCTYIYYILTRRTRPMFYVGAQKCIMKNVIYICFLMCFFCIVLSQEAEQINGLHWENGGKWNATIQNAFRIYFWDGCVLYSAIRLISVLHVSPRI